MNRKYSALALAPVAASWAAIFIRFCHSDPILIAAYRMTFATAFLAPVYLLRPGKPAVPQGRDLSLVILAGVCLAAHFAVWITALFYTSIASATVLVTIQPLFLTILAQLVFKERAGVWGYAAIVLALIGAAVIGWGDLQLSSRQLIGDLMALSAALFAAIYLLVGKKLIGKLGLINYIFPVYAISGAILVGMALVGSRAVVPQHTADYLWFALLALIPTLIGHTLYNYSLKHIKAHLVGITILGEPVLAVIWALFIFAEVPTLFTILGSVIIFAAIIFTFLRQDEVSP